ncbi:MAG: 4Fe-4S binding protein [Clostridia bacterium]|nr:4Fe-4S binding protein [Clostridia bacterium]
MKDRIRDYVLGLGVDDVGFAAVADYHSVRSPQLTTIFSAAKSMVVLAHKELSNCDSPNMQIAFSGRMDLMEFARSCNYKVARFLEREYQARAMTVSPSYPLEMSYDTMGSIGDVSLRHAAVAAGLGTFGRHNLVLHPEFGTRVIFTVILCDLDLPSDPPIQEELCNQCDLCVQSCPAGALEEAGKTDIGKCLKKSQPYGIGANIHFYQKVLASSPEEQKNMLKDPEFWRLYQAGFIGFQYFCFNCLKSCPVGQK